MRRQRVRLGALLAAIGLGAALAAGCGNKEPEPNGKGYDAGPAESKGASGKSPGGMPGGGPATPAPQ